MKLIKSTLIGLFTISIITVNAQVGIGTNTPDASSILDMTSTTQGVLTPRMTTTQRNAISNPAEGLLVFDITLDAFYFYEGSSWMALEGAEKRDNYKLVKSVADLADELVAGGGSKYLLSSNYLYEVNGTITLDYPIELNGAYLRGDDNLDDRLVNNSGGTLFVGTTGGNLKRLSIYANSQQVFDVSGGGTQNLVSFSVNYIQSSSLGNISNFNLVFFNLGQFLANGDGLTVTDVTSYFMTLFYWSINNTGTFLTLSGTFNEIQLSNSRLNVGSGETGIDVSANPNITGAASINQVSFDGDGTFVNGYTTDSYIGYRFTKDWFVQCQGVLQESDEVSTGSVYITTPIETSIAAVNTPIKVAGTTTAYGLFRTTSSTDNRIEYTGTKTRYFKYTASVSITAATNNKRFNFYIAKNGVVLAESKQSRKISTGADIGSISTSGLIQLQTGDYIELWVENIDDSTNITAQSMNLMIN